MLKNYFITAWRNLVKGKFYSAINIFAVSPGNCMFSIIVFVYQLSCKF